MNENKNIIIANPTELQRKKEAIRRGGAQNLHVLADFDRTLTYAIVNGLKHVTLIGILREEKYLTPDYPKKARALKNKYRPIEFDLSIPLPERKAAMREWWMKHINLLVESRYNRKDLEKAIVSTKIKLREGVDDFVDYLQAREIPFVVMSATGLGREAITLFFKKEGKLLNNVHVVANTWEWNENGFAKGVREPIIHSLNKDETAIHQFPVFEKIKDRKNILLLGDSTGDAGMDEGFDAENVIKVGFLNEKVEENLEHYKKLYDIVIINDPPFDYVIKLIEETI